MHFDLKPLESEWELQWQACYRALEDHPDVIGVDIGYEYDGLKPTGDVAIRLFVVRKIPEANLAPHQKKDLREEVKRLSLTQFRLPFDILEMPLTGREPHPPEPERTSRAATLQPGLSVSCSSEGAGTLGAIVYTREGEPALLTCAHVAAPGDGHEGLPIFQPSPVDHGEVSFDMVARLTQQNRQLDAAVATLTGARMVRLGQLGTETLVAQADQVRTLGMVLTKSGRGTGVTEGRVDGIGCYKLRQTSSTPTWTPGFILLSPDALSGGRELSAQGDSGAVWYRQCGEGFGIGYGLHLTGERTEAQLEYAIATHLQLVLESLDVTLLPPDYPYPTQPFTRTSMSPSSPSIRTTPLRKERLLLNKPAQKPAPFRRTLPPAFAARVQAAGTSGSAPGALPRGSNSSLKTYLDFEEKARENVRTLLGVPKDHPILFLPGGASLQFAMVPMNLRTSMPKAKAEYAISGVWSERAYVEAYAVDPDYPGRNKWPDCAKDIYKPDPKADYLHYTSNETLDGRKNPPPPNREKGVPLVADMSSDLLTRPLPDAELGLIYASTYRNAWAQGLTVVILSEDLLKRSKDQKHLASSLSYWQHSQRNPAAGRPPIESLYWFYEATQWLRYDVGGLHEIEQVNAAKARTVYAAIDFSGGFYSNTVALPCRSHLNVVWRVIGKDGKPDPLLKEKLLCEAEEWGFYLLDHGRHDDDSQDEGIRASLYNFVVQEEVDYLVQFMDDFRDRYRPR